MEAVERRARRESVRAVMGQKGVFRVQVGLLRSDRSKEHARRERLKARCDTCPCGCAVTVRSADGAPPLRLDNRATNRKRGGPFTGANRIGPNTRVPPGGPLRRLLDDRAYSVKRAAACDRPAAPLGVGGKRHGRAPPPKPAVPRGEQWDALLDAISKTLGRCTQPVRR